MCEAQKESYKFPCYLSALLHRLMRNEIYWEVKEAGKQSHPGLNSFISLRSVQHARSWVIIVLYFVITFYIHFILPCFFSILGNVLASLTPLPAGTSCPLPTLPAPFLNTALNLKSVFPLQVQMCLSHSDVLIHRHKSDKTCRVNFVCQHKRLWNWSLD